MKTIDVGRGYGAAGLVAVAVLLHMEHSRPALPGPRPWREAPLELYGMDVEGLTLGTGNPGDDGVQFGLHVKVVHSSPERAQIEIWKRLDELELSSTTTAVTPDVSAFELGVVANIGGALSDPTIVLELPPEIDYIPGSASGGLMPAGSGGGCQAVADDVEAARTPPSGDVASTRYLVWRGRPLATGASLPPLGFRYRAREGAAVAIRAELFENGNERFQVASLNAAPLR